MQIACDHHKNTIEQNAQYIYNQIVMLKVLFTTLQP